MPPDGMTFKEDLTAPQLGITWHSLTLPRFDHAFGSNAGSNSWTLFMNTSNFKGPLVFVAPQFWADGAIGNPTQKGLSLDTKSGQVGGLASEWNSIPYYKYLDADGKVYTKIPCLVEKSLQGTPQLYLRNIGVLSPQNAGSCLVSGVHV